MTFRSCTPLRSAALGAGIIDHCYVATLEAAIATAKSDPAKARIVARAKNFLGDLRRRIPVDMRTLVGHSIDARAAGTPLGGEFRNTDKLNHVRWAMARYITELHEIK